MTETPSHTTQKADSSNQVECPMCNGHGCRHERKCKLCGGEGVVAEQVAVNWPVDQL